MTRHVLLMEGPDAKGLIYHVTKVLFANNCNVFRQDEYVSPSGHFFMRTEFEANDSLLPASILSDLHKAIPDERINFRANPKMKKDVVVFCTKEHHCLSDLLTRFHFNELEATIKAVVSNYDVLRPYVEMFGIPFHYVSHEGCSREEHEQKLLNVSKMYNPQYVVLAKYMRILSPMFVEAFPDRIINIHHSFLPAFIGANPYRQAYDRGVKLIGATAHFVNNDLDDGPIIAQDIKKVNHRYTSKDMAREGREIEKTVLTRALKLVFSDRVFIYDNRTIIL